MKQVGLAVAVLVAAWSARAEDVRRFGNAGEWVPSGSLSFFYTSSYTNITLSPAVQYFVSDNVAIGLGLLYAHGSFGAGQSFNAYGISPSIGYNLRFSDSLSLFPQFLFTVEHLSGLGPGADLSATVLGFNLFAPLLFHPVSHFFLGIGPSLLLSGEYDDPVSSQGLTVRTVIGGWF